MSESMMLEEIAKTLAAAPEAEGVVVLPAGKAREMAQAVRTAAQEPPLEAPPVSLVQREISKKYPGTCPTCRGTGVVTDEWIRLPEAVKRHPNRTDGSFRRLVFFAEDYGIQHLFKRMLLEGRTRPQVFINWPKFLEWEESLTEGASR